VAFLFSTIITPWPMPRLALGLRERFCEKWKNFRNFRLKMEKFPRNNL
jgi:hypothetical protein